MATTMHEVEMTIKMKVAVTDEVRKNINEQYPKSMKGKDDQYIAEAVAYAWMNPRTPQEVDYDCYFDGVANMKGLITEIEVTE